MESIESKILSLFPSATRAPELDTENKIWTVYQLNEIIGYAYESNDFVDFKGFSGERINMLIGLDTQGMFTGLTILHHHEPIFIYGLGPEPLIEFINQYPLHSLSDRIIFGSPKAGQEKDAKDTYFDGITKATISIIVINDTILSSAREVARKVLPSFAQKAPAIARTDLFTKMNWDNLLSNDLVKYWRFTQQDIEALVSQDLSHYPPGQLNLTKPHTDIYYAYLNAPTIGKNLLGEHNFQRLMAKLDDGEQAIAIMSNGFYNYLGSDFRSGAIPENIRIEQHNLPITIRDVNLPDAINPQLAIKNKIDNLHIFKIRPQAGFDPSAPMQLLLNMKLHRNHIAHDNVTLSSNYSLPSSLFDQTSEDATQKPEATWLKIWKGRQLHIFILTASLLLLTLAFTMQRKLVAHSKGFTWFRRVFLLYTLVYIGLYTQGQLSIVNLIALLVGIINNFDVQVFLLDPIIFILLCYTAFTLLLWGRGLFCGWPCPFGVMQELLANVAIKTGIKQWRIKPALHDKLLKIKYIILVTLLLIAPYSLTTAEKMAEIEPFKTAVTLAFIREWPFVIYAVLILALGLFIHKFYCRYLCPLGAALAILGKLHRFKWLDRQKACGNPCQLCKRRCGIDAIKKTGEIDYDECIQCLECVVILQDPKQCAATLSARKKSGNNTAPVIITPIKSV
ncbi:Putative electron transport protein YccM [Zhongshania aliphaticivorans]|uniref:Electron transport protein YccM n=1 Tax=Zhongshania aliphaticivorans TaxID=1470434 RepID=A0A5S9MV07_9GAMM|nr:NosR/NirI family protein [Zhongshania aliphaticivorans]CAA0080701.1 Putative electron transport protein YccM [Zhongshania aliphaticivorans]CAA0085439.1 Putative electron transport protein YccM [Zhongshania aliphaticivorans]